MINFICSSCGKQLSVSQEYAGKTGKCPKCKNIIVVPEVQEVAATAQQDLTDVAKPDTAEPTRRCPYCGELILAVASKCKHCGEFLGERPMQAPIAAPGVAGHEGYAGTAEGYEFYYAGFWRRFAAALIDAVVLTAAGFVVGGIFGCLFGMFLGAMGEDLPTIQQVCGVVGNVIGIVINWLYFTLLECSSKQATVGKMALGIVVTDMYGNRISFGRANGRYWGKIISALTLCVGYIMAGFTAKKQALHDMMSGCLVVKK